MMSLQPSLDSIWLIQGNGKASTIIQLPPARWSLVRVLILGYFMKRFQFNENSLNTSQIFLDNPLLKSIASMVISDFFDMANQTGILEYTPDEYKGAVLMSYMYGALRNIDIIKIEDKNTILEELFTEI